MIVILSSTVIFDIYGNDYDIDAVGEFIRSFGLWSSFIFVLFYAIAAIFIPTTPLMVAAGLLFGFRYGFFYSIIGGFISMLITFFFARKTGRESIEKILKNKRAKYLEKYDNRLKKNGILDLIILRILPVMPFNILNIIMGISKISLREYIIGSLIGLIPSHIATVYLGTLVTKIF